MSSLGVPSAGGFINIPLLNVNFLYIQGVPYVDFSGSIVYLQQEIDHIDNEVTALQAVVNRIDLTGLTGNLVITDANKNSELLTQIQALQGNIGQINKLDLTALPNAPPASCIITTATTNQALKALIDTNTGNITTLNTRVTDLSNQVIALQNQVTSINNSITALNAKTAHISVYTVAGGTVMTGIRDNTGFAVDMSADDSSNGLFVYPNGDGHNAQIRLETAQDKQLYMRGGGAVLLYAGANGSITNRNAIFIGDQTDNIKIGSFTGTVDYPLIDIGASGVVDSRTNLRGDVYLTKGTEVSPIYTQVVTADGDAGFVGRLDTQSRLSLSGLAVTTTATNPVIPITNLFGAITLTTGAGLISLIAGVGGINLTAGGGAVAISTGGGAMSINCGAGVLNMASGTGNSNWTTANGDIYLGAGKGTGGSAGAITLASLNNIVIQPDASLNLYHTEFIEMLSSPNAPAVTALRIYDISGNLWYNGQQLTNGTDPSGVFVKIDGSSTMTGTLVTPAVEAQAVGSLGDLTFTALGDISMNCLTQITMQKPLIVPSIVTSEIGSFVTDLSLNSSLNLIVTPALEGRYNRTGYIEFLDNSGAPAVTANRLYQQANQLFFDGSAIGGGGGNFLPLTGGTLTGALNINYNAGNSVHQLSIVNTSNTAPTSAQGANIVLQNNATGTGSIGERCGSINFEADDSLGTTGRTYASIQSFITDPTSTAIDGRLSTFVANNNSTTEIMRLQSTSTSIRRCDIGTTYMEIGATAIGSTSTSTLTVNGTANVVTSLQTPLIANAVNIYPATSTTLVDNAVRQYQPERLYKLTTYPEPLGPPTRDGEKVYFVNPTGNPSTAMDGFLPYTAFQNVSGFTTGTWEYIQKSIFYKGSSVTGGLDAWYYSCRFSDGNSYLFGYTDFAGGVWKLYGIAKIYGEVRDLAVGNPAYQGGGLNHRLYFCGQFATGDTATGTAGVSMNNVGQVTTVWIATGGITTIAFNQLDSTKDPAVAHEPNFQGIIGVAGQVNCIVNASGLNTWGLPDNADIIVIGGQFYNIGATGGVVNYRNLASLAWYNPTYTSGLQDYEIGWSTLANNSTNTAVVCGVGNSSQGETVWGVGFQSDGWGVVVYSGQNYNDETGTVIPCNYMAYFYKSNANVTFGVPSGDAEYIQTGQTFPKENAYNQTNIIKGGNPSGATAVYGDFTYTTLCVCNGLTPAGGANWGVSWRPNSGDPYQTSLALVIEGNDVVASKQPLTQFSPLQVVSFYSNQTVYPDTYFLNTYSNSASVYESYYAVAPFTNPNYQGLSVQGSLIPMRGHASYSTILGYTGLNFYGMSLGLDANNCVYLYKTTNAGDLTVELSGCLVRTSPNIYASDTITFLGASDGSSLMLLGDTSTTGNPQGKPSWWAISQDGAIKYDNVTVDSGGINTIVAGTGISEVTNAGSVTITNTGVTSIVAGTGISITSTGTGGTGDVTVNATGGDTTGYLKYYLQSTSNGGIVSLANQTNNIQSNTPLPAFYFLPNNPRTATGIATQFDLYNDGSLPSGTGWIRWGGATSVTFQMVVPISVSTYAGGVRISLPNTATYAYSNFGLASSVFNSTTGLENTDNPQRIVWAGASSITNLNNGANEPFDYEGELVINGILKTNDYIKIYFCANGVFNQAGQPANVYTAISLGQLQTLTVQYTSYP